MIHLTGATVVQPGGLLSPATLTIEGDRIAEITAGHEPHDGSVQLHDHYIVPGFVDVHVHGVAGVDSLAALDAVARIARHLPRHGVTAFCPTSMACDPGVLRTFLESVREEPAPGLSLGRLGPVTEGAFGWIVGIGALIGCAVWLGAKSS